MPACGYCQGQPFSSTSAGLDIGGEPQHSACWNLFLGRKYPTQRCQHGRETPVGRAQTACFTFYLLRANRKNLSGGDQYEDELTLAQHAYRFAALETRHPCSSVVHFAVTEQMGSVESVQRRQGHATAPTTCGIAASNSDRCLRSKQAGGVTVQS